MEIMDFVGDFVGLDPKGKKYPPGIVDAVEKAVRDVDLTAVLSKVSSTQKWNKKKTSKAAKAYRKALEEFTLAFDGRGVVAGVENDASLIWQEHCLEGKKYADDMTSIVAALVSFHGKSLDEKYPGPDE
jgi:hypothetical protein